MVTLANLGFPRIGRNRELKFALEKFWRGEIPLASLRKTAREIRIENWQMQRSAGIQVIPCGDFSLYDHVLDHLFMFGAIPPRFEKMDAAEPEDLYFSLARGFQQSSQQPIAAMEMTKWFNTNYHYIVPEINPDTQFTLHPEKLINEIQQAAAMGINVRPIVLGPVSFILLSKSTIADFDPLAKLGDLLPMYQALFSRFQEESVTWIQLDEPFLATDLSPLAWAAYEMMFSTLAKTESRPKVMLTAYFADLQLNSNLVQQSPFEGVHIDLTHSNHPEEMAAKLVAQKTISLGIISGRNVWREDMQKAAALIRSISNRCPTKEIQIAPSCSLLHLPYDVEREDQISPEVRSWMAFAQQKLEILSALGQMINKDNADNAFLQRNQHILASRHTSSFVSNRLDQPALSEINAQDLTRISPFPQRKILQDAALHLPLLPTTTIGSFPQTGAVRKARADALKGAISADEYQVFLKEEIKRSVDFQEETGIDVFVHGEFERNDMVQYFGEKLSGFTFSKYGWVQSYGSRYVRPPIIYGDVSRPQAMTVEWTTYAQSLTEKPMKGMLTGPVTIMLWSFIRDDQPLSETCKQIAYAIRQEVIDLEAAGTRVIQIDEPALREGLPIQKNGWDAYLNWAVKCFRIASSGVRDKTQIHTHMCYAEFNDIIDAIIALDADVISVEASRSKMELLDAFKEKAYPNEIGPGVYDIHSPNIPLQDEMVGLLQKALTVIPAERLWVNPDCGLKTRRWEEVRPALQNMVAAARTVREKLNKMEIGSDG